MHLVGDRLVAKAKPIRSFANPEQFASEYDEKDKYYSSTEKTSEEQQI